LIKRKRGKAGLVERSVNWRGYGALSYGTWNVRGLNGKEIELFEQMKRLKVPFLGITETKKKGKGYEVLHGGSIVLYSGVDPSERAKAGVACLVNSSDYVNFVWNWSLTNERIMSVRYAVVPTNFSLLTITLQYCLRTTFIYNNTKYSVPCMAL
jgi:hypothetical protein